MSKFKLIIIVSLLTVISSCSSNYTIVYKDASSLGDPIIIDTLNINTWGITSNEKYFEIDENVCPSGDIYSATIMRKFKYKLISFLTFGYHYKIDLKIICRQELISGTLEN